jgi:arginine deiminase
VEALMTILNAELVEMIQLAVDLANSLQEDLEDNRQVVSDATIALLSQFRQKHDYLNEVLDVESGLQ